MVMMNELGEFVDEWDANVDEIRQANNARVAALKRRQRVEGDGGKPPARGAEGAGVQGLDDGRGGAARPARTADDLDEPRQRERERPEGRRREDHAERHDDDAGDLDAAEAGRRPSGAPGREHGELLGIEPGVGGSEADAGLQGGLGEEAAGEDGGGPLPSEAWDEDGIRRGLPMRQVQGRDEAEPENNPDAQGHQGPGRGSSTGTAALLVAYLFDQIEMLQNVDRSDAADVDAACSIAKAVNDTAGNIIDLANASTKAAMLRSNISGCLEVPSFFLEERSI